MSGNADIMTTHDVTERLSWETQAPLTVRPSEFKPFPAKTNWEVERAKMKTVCYQCHGKAWVDMHYDDLDNVVQEYNEVYFKPANAKMKELWDKGLVDPSRKLDEKIEFEYYELWHHEGRRARMGAAMMGPDYAWWHGFYYLKKRFTGFMKAANHMLETGEKGYMPPVFPNDTGDTTRPAQIFGE
jgi:hypothetical protein